MSLNTEFLFFPLEAEVASPLLRHPNLAQVLTHVRGFKHMERLSWIWSLLCASTFLGPGFPLSAAGSAGLMHLHVWIEFRGWQGLELSAGVPHALDEEQGGDNSALCRNPGWAVTAMVTPVYLQQDDAQWDLCRQFSTCVFGFIGCDHSRYLGE